MSARRTICRGIRLHYTPRCILHIVPAEIDNPREEDRPCRSAHPSRSRVLVSQRLDVAPVLSRPAVPPRTRVPRKRESWRGTNCHVARRVPHCLSRRDGRDSTTHLVASTAIGAAVVRPIRTRPGDAYRARHGRAVAYDRPIFSPGRRERRVYGRAQNGRRQERSTVRERERARKPRFSLSPLPSRFPLRALSRAGWLTPTMMHTYTHARARAKSFSVSVSPPSLSLSLPLRYNSRQSVGIDSVTSIIGLYFAVN